MALTQCIPDLLTSLGFFFSLFLGDWDLFCFALYEGFFWKNGKIATCTHTQGTLTEHCLQEYLILRVDHQIGSSTDLQRTDKN